MQPVILVSPADTSLPECQRQAEGSWKAPHTPFKRSWTPLAPMSDRGEGRGGEGVGGDASGGSRVIYISNYDVITVASKVLLRHT